MYRVQTAKNIKNAWVKIGYQTMFVIRGCLYVPAWAHIQKIAGGGVVGMIWHDFPVLQQTYVATDSTEIEERNKTVTNFL
jgi:hypothetical protein